MTSKRLLANITRVPTVPPARSWSRMAPQEMRSLSTLGRADYTDFFSASIPPGQQKSAEGWARQTLDVSSGSLRGLAVAVQRAVLGLRLEPDDPKRILGWEISGQDEDWIRLSAASRLLGAELVFRVANEQLWVSTFLRYDRPPAALIWRLAKPAHRRVGLLMMDRAFRRRGSRPRRL